MAAARESYDILAATGAAPGEVVDVDLSIPEPAAPGVTATMPDDSAEPSESTAVLSASTDPSDSTPSSSSASSSI